MMDKIDTLVYLISITGLLQCIAPKATEALFCEVTGHHAPLPRHYQYTKCQTAPNVKLHNTTFISSLRSCKHTATDQHIFALKLIARRKVSPAKRGELMPLS